MKDKEKTKKAYEKMEKKYKLPKLKKVEDELNFEISSSKPVHDCLKRMADLINMLIEHLGIIFEPRGYPSIIESSFYNEKEKEKLFKKFKEMMSLYHELAVGIFEGEKEQAKLFKKVFAVYTKEIKKFSIDFFTRQGDKWKEFEPDKFDKGQYLG